MNVFEKSFLYKVIYIFRVNNDSHRGLLKIGDATIQTNDSIDKLSPNCKALNQAAKERIKQYTNTAGVEYDLLHTELAVRTVEEKDGTLSLKAFRDHHVHRVLENSGIPKKQIKNSTSREWFEVDLDTAKEAINAVKQNLNNLSNTSLETFTPIVFRPEQKDAIKQTLEQFKIGNKMLWNAKMRFGKTLSALEVIRKLEFKKTIIITHRPVVDKGWYEDFTKIFHGIDNYLYGSKGTGYNSLEQLLKCEENFVYFASIQDLRGSDKVGGKFDKNNEVFSLDWDFVIVDEAHEGTTTQLGADVITELVKEHNGHQTKLLELSGTPFNILQNYDDNIYTWDYVMEQKNKKTWDEEHFGDSNPYEELPELKIYTYDLGKILSNGSYVELEDKAFNFREFFRVWTGDIKSDFKQKPDDVEIGEFVHKKDILSFLNLITKEDKDSKYPYSSEEYRDLFKHSLWMVPGVKEAKALSKMLNNHPVFGSGAFKIVNVAGDGDEEEKSDEALNKVKTAIKDAGSENYTITLSCGKLTTGVTVPEWTAVFMLSGSFSTSAANYLQTIFRVQSPCNINGQIKSCCYVFDFAPDRTLKMVADSASISAKAGKTNDSDRKIMGEFLNYCPVIAVSGTEMKEYDTNRLLQQLKKAYAERAVQNGFDDNNLYNEELLKLDEIELEKFTNLKKIVGSSKAQQKTKDIDVNNQGFTDEEHDEIKRIEKKKKSERTPEDEERLKELSEKKKMANTARSILRGISIRMPLLIYGANVKIGEDVKINDFLNEDIIDTASWEEFMPTGVTKELFKEFIKYYDPEIFVSAGRKIRNIVKSADELPPTQRVIKIAQLFSCFKNPDKETVLTPWRVVNMHMGDCLGGYSFYDENYKEVVEEPRYINQGDVTDNTLSNTSAKILEINSKTGLYPLYVTYSIFRAKCDEYKSEELTLELEEKLWKDTVCKNVFVICKTPMAKSITKRTLVGFKDVSVNSHYFEDLINTMKHKPKQFKDRVTRPNYWKLEGVKKVKFDAVVGNPPYQETTGGAGVQAKPIYNYFVEQSKRLNAEYVSMITPSRWFSGGMGLDNFRDNMTQDNKLVMIKDYVNAKDCFPQISISGGVNYFLWNNSYNGDCKVENVHDGKSSVAIRPTNEFTFFVRYNDAVSALHKILFNTVIPFKSIDSIISPLMPFGLSTNYRGRTEIFKEDCLSLYASTGVTYIKSENISKGMDYIDKYKVMMSKMSAEHAGEPDKNGMFSIFTKTMKVLVPNEVCTHSYFLIGKYDSQVEAYSTLKYLKTKFVRFIVMTTLSAVNLSKLVFGNVPLQDFTEKSDIDWSKAIPEIDKQLYAKYNLTEEEIIFIESKIKPME